MFKVMSIENVFKLMELTKQPYRPAQIIALKEQIEAKTRVAELKYTTIGNVDPADIQEIVRMKLDLDSLYAYWVEGKLE
ncbi:MAG: hypothetical protein AAB972_02900 [Patescibacteria group bacterium]